MKNSKRLICIILTVLICLIFPCGCHENNKDIADDFSVPNSYKSDQEAENRDKINSLLQSWTIFNNSFSENEPTIMNENMRSVIKDAIASESNNQKVNLTLYCPYDLADDYKRFADSFRQLYNDPQKCIINIKIQKTNSLDNYISNPRNGADVFLCSDLILGKAAVSGAAAKINENLQKLSADANVEDSVKACTFNNEVYGFPLSSGDGYYLIYDKRIFNAQDVCDIDSIIDKAAENSKNFVFPLDDPYYSASVFLTAGCKIEYSGSTIKSDLNTNGLIAAKALCDLLKKHKNGFVSSGDTKSVITGFSNGTVCAAVTDSSIFNDIKSAAGDYNIGIAKLPTITINGKKTDLHSFSGFNTVGVNPYSHFPFTAQMLAYYISSETCQMDIYNKYGIIPSMIFHEYDHIVNDQLYNAIQQQNEFSHIRSLCISSDFSAVMKPYSIGSIIIEKNGSISDQELKNILSEIPASVPAYESTDSDVPLQN